MSDTQLRYDISVDDMIAFNLHHYQSSAEMRKVRNLRWFTKPLTTIGIIGMLYFVMTPAQKASREMHFMVLGYLVFLAVLVVAWVMFFPKLWRRAIVRAVRKSYARPDAEGAIGWRTLRYDENVLAERSALGETEKRWADVDRADVAERHAFFYIGESAAFVLPRHAFATEAAFDAFVEMARGRIAKAAG